MIRFIKTFLSIIFLTTQCAYADVSHQQSEEDLFKAAFIYNFAKFTSWPANTPGQDGPLILCTTETQESAINLKRLSGKVIKGRLVAIRSLQEHSVELCHMLYISGSNINLHKKLLTAVQGKPVLTVSDLKGFVQQGGIIQFFRKKGKTRMIINLDNARKVGLEISSRLLILAEVISTKEAR